MRKLITVAVFALLVAACGSGASGETVTMEYAFAAGDGHTYLNEFSASVTSDFSGIDAGDVPEGPVEIDLAASVLTSYAIEEGPDEGTYRVSVSFDELSDASFTVRGMGEDTTYTEDDVPSDIAEGALPGREVTFVVDSNGAVLSLESDGTEIPLPSSGFGGISGFGTETPFLGPELPEGEIAVGDTWTSAWEVDLFGDQSISFSAESTFEEIDGSGYYVISTRTTASPIEVDFADLLGGLLGDEAPQGGEFTLTMRISQDVATTTVWFDPERGITARQSYTRGSDIEMSFAAEGESGTVRLSSDMTGTMELQD